MGYTFCYHYLFDIKKKVGRAFSVLTLISSVTMPIGLLFSSPIAEKVGVNVWFFISGLCMIALTTLVMIRFAAKHRKQETGVSR